MFTGDADEELRRLAARPGFRHADAARRALRFRAGGDVADLVAVRDDPHPCGMVDVVFGLAGHQRPWLNRVPMPTETSVASANHIGARQARGERITLSEAVLTAGEPASAIIACQRVLGPYTLRTLAFPAPDIRVRLRPGRYTVWRYDGTDPLPAVPAPSDRAVELVREVGNETWPSMLSGHLRAAPLGELPLDDLLGLLAHLPGPPDNPRWRHLATSTPTYWYRLMQPWVCLGILHQAPDEPWRDSTRREVLVDLALGVEDWVADAALFALVTAAYREPALRTEVRALVRERLDAAVAANRVVTIEESLARLMLVTPDRTRDDHAVATAALAEKRSVERFGKRRWWHRPLWTRSTRRPTGEPE